MLQNDVYCWLTSVERRKERKKEREKEKEGKEGWKGRKEEGRHISLSIVHHSWGPSFLVLTAM